MADDIVTRLKGAFHDWTVAREVDPITWVDAADEIERLREWAAYEHAGYCGCAGGNKECLNRAYTTWRKMFHE